MDFGDLQAGEIGRAGVKQDSVIPDGRGPDLRWQLHTGSRIPGSRVAAPGMTAQNRMGHPQMNDPSPSAHDLERSAASTNTLAPLGLARLVTRRTRSFGKNIRFWINLRAA